MNDIEVKLTDVIKILNEAVEADPDAIRSLIFQRVPCNEKLAQHPTIQVGTYHSDGKHMIGVLGLLNGIFGIRDDGYGYLCANFEVVCPNGHEPVEGATVRDLCPVCDTKYVLGKLIDFRFTPKDKS